MVVVIYIYSHSSITGFLIKDPTDEFTKESVKRIAAGRLGEKEELSNLAAYLLSDYSNWMTGQVVTFDGGESTAMVS